ncbi:Uncharacterised protein [Yersinia pekkanenii]|uniref:Lipoprotein n=1 Tax=Yersinia pekkanenii TaxID=1288385 RepID=A0A0T9R0V7_9GAMM|nr:Uncharacterised protein [Yersinia pekkanenii]
MRNIIRCCFVIATLTITSPAFATACMLRPDNTAEQCAKTCVWAAAGGLFGYLLCL